MHALRLLPVIGVLSVGALALPTVASAQNHLGGKPWNPRDQVNFSVFRNGTTSNIKVQTMQEIPTENDFQVYWTKATGQAPETAPVGIDWKREKLLAIHLGQRPTGGFSVFVQNIQRQGSVAVVEAVEQTPSPRQVVTQSVTNPWVIVKVDRIAVPYRLSLTQREGMQIPGGRVIYTAPGTVFVSPNQFDRPGGGGYVDPKRDTDWTTLTSGTRCRIRQPRMVNIDNQAAWGLHWNTMMGQSPGSAPNLDVDWPRYKLVVLHLGDRPTGGYSLHVTNVEKNGVNGIIRAVEMKPVPGAFVSEALTSPWVVVRVPRNLATFRVEMSERQVGPGDVRISGGG